MYQIYVPLKQTWLLICIAFFIAVKAIKVTYVHDDKAQAANNGGIRYELCQRDIRV